MNPPWPPPPEAAKRRDRVAKIVTVFVAVIAATAVVCGFLNSLESGQANDETRAGLAAQARASELSIRLGQVADQDFDNIAAAEVHAFTASELDARGFAEDAGLERSIALFLLTATYGYAYGYYPSADLESAVYSYETSGFVQVWNAYTTYTDGLQAGVDAQQAEAEAHLVAASDAGRKAGSFTLSAVLMAVAVALGTVALSTESKRMRQADLVLIASLYGLGWANLVWTLLS